MEDPNAVLVSAALKAQETLEGFLHVALDSLYAEAMKTNPTLPVTKEDFLGLVTDASKKCLQQLTVATTHDMEEDVIAGAQFTLFIMIVATKLCLESIINDHPNFVAEIDEGGIGPASQEMLNPK